MRFCSEGILFSLNISTFFTPLANEFTSLSGLRSLPLSQIGTQVITFGLKRLRIWQKWNRIRNVLVSRCRLVMFQSKHSGKVFFLARFSSARLFLNSKKIATFNYWTSCLCAAASWVMGDLGTESQLIEVSFDKVQESFLGTFSLLVFYKILCQKIPFQSFAYSMHKILSDNKISQKILMKLLKFNFTKILLPLIDWLTAATIPSDRQPNGSVKIKNLNWRTNKN